MLFPTTVPMREILRNWRGVFAKMKKSKRPVVILSNNKPQAALVDLDLLQELRLDAVYKEALEDMRQGKGKIIDSSEELEEDLKDLEKYVKG